MKNVFLAPRSNETSHQNFESTITVGRPYSFVEPYLTDEEKEVLSSYPTLQVWGNKESLRSRWEKMSKGDYVLFYAKGGFNYSAQVILRKHSPELGRELWPVDDDGSPWTCLFFVGNLHKVNIPIRVVQELAEYEPTWDRVQGFMMLRENGTEAIAAKFGSIEAFLSQDPETYNALESLIESTKEETLEVEQEHVLDKTLILRDAANFKYDRESHKLDSSPRKVRIENQTQKRRIAALEDYSCQICGWNLEWTNSKGKKCYRIDVDHIIDKAKGGTEDIQNLWVLCPNCHAKKTLGVITVDLHHGKVLINDVETALHHDNHLNWKSNR